MQHLFCLLYVLILTLLLDQFLGDRSPTEELTCSQVVSIFDYRTKTNKGDIKMLPAITRGQVERRLAVSFYKIG